MSKPAAGVFTFFFMLCVFFPFSSFAASKPQVMVVMSYHEGYVWVEHIKQGIYSVLGDNYSTTYFFLDTKNNFRQGPAKAEQAYALFQKLRPDVVIAADDNAQSMFVVPYLRNRTSTPVVFCGVNEDPEVYGYPSSNVTGILERFHVRETIALLKQLVPSVETIGFILRGGTETTKALIKQMKAEQYSYPVEVYGFAEPETLEKAEKVVQEYGKECDCVYLEHFEGIRDARGKTWSNNAAVNHLVEILGPKPTICSNSYTVEAGILCAVIESGVEQGAEAAEAAGRIIDGTSVSDIPIQRNIKGKQVINVSALRALNITPNPSILREAELVKTNKP